MELTDNDLQRIEDFITKLGWDEKGTAEFNDMMKVAEYATKYEREQQAPLLRELEEFKNGNLMDEYTVELSDKVERLEAERTELRNKVIERESLLKEVIQVYYTMEDQPDTFYDLVWKIKKTLNSLKTK